MQTLVCEEIVDDRVENPMASEVQQGAVVVYHSFVVATKRTTVTIFQEDLRHSAATLGQPNNMMQSRPKTNGNAHHVPVVHLRVTRE